MIDPTRTPGFNTAIPEQILTPDRVETRIGELEFFDGLPSPSSVEKLYDNLDLMRGVETFLSGVPAASLEALRTGFAEIGVDACNELLIADALMDSDPLFLTGNTDTVYCAAILDLKRDGPTVVEIPPNCGPGTVDDAFFRFVVDIGAPGPDRGAGGSYLLLPPGYEGTIAAGEDGAEVEVDGKTYFAARSTSFVNLILLRGFLVDSKPDAATAMFEAGVRVYPLSRASNPPETTFTSLSRRPFNTIHANTFEFYEELHRVVDREPISMLDPELRGLFASIGIQKGKPFAPDPRLRRILTEAVAIGNATARAIAFRPRLAGAPYYPGSAWSTPMYQGNNDWLLDGGAGGRDLDARTFFFYLATLNTPAMVLRIPGVGSQYAIASCDVDGAYLDGAENYRLNIPTEVPAKDFWSVVLYDPQTRSELQTGEAYPSKNSKRDSLLENADGSVDLYFGPTPPTGMEANWTETVPGKGWFTLLRLYGPLEPWFEKTWRPGEIERLVD